jgi:hypothetical protein
MLRRNLYGLLFQSFSLIPGKESLQVIAVGTIPAKPVLVEQALDTAARTDLVCAALGTYRPAHLAVPAAPEHYCRSS